MGKEMGLDQSENLARFLFTWAKEARMLEPSPVLLEALQDTGLIDNLDKDMLNEHGAIYLALSAWIARKQTSRPVVFGFNGAQGSGKTTLCRILKSLLSAEFGKNVIHLSIDDLYYSRDKREELSRQVHPLLKIRGVPGTHDVDTGIEIFSTLINAVDNNEVLLPVFDKATDDVLPESMWLRVNHPVDIILFEGWCVGSGPQNQEDLADPVNELESIHDSNSIWRSYVNQQLAGPYQDLFSFIDYLVMLQVPDMDSVYKWRMQQEQQLDRAGENKGVSTGAAMTDKELKRFIMHFERITRHTLSEMPGRADIVLKLNRQHQIHDVMEKKDA